MKTISRVSVSDGGALELATSLLIMAYGLPASITAESLKQALGLGETTAHTVETAFSYPNGVALVRDERGRMSLYLYDSDQERLTEGGQLRVIDPDTPVAAAAPTAGDADGKAVAKTGAADEAAAIEPPPPPSTVLAADTGALSTGTAVLGDRDGTALGADVDAKAADPSPGPGMAIETDAPAAAADLADSTGYAGAADLGKGEGAIEARPVSGETAGHPIDGATGEPIELTAEERERIKGVTIGDAIADQGTALGADVQREGVVIGESDTGKISDVLDTGSKSGTDEVAHAPVDVAGAGTAGAVNDAVGASAAPAGTTATVGKSPEAARAFEEGKASRAIGNEEHACPYDAESAEGRAWAEGYDWRQPDAG